MSAPAPPRRPRQAATKRAGVREASAQETRESILRAAITEFAKNGYAGGRIEQISKAANSHDRMIYYYFGNKEALFAAVLGEIYRRFNVAEAKLEIDLERPVESLRIVVSFMWNYYRQHPEFITLLNSENLHRGKHIGKLMGAREYSSPAVDVIARVLASGAALGLFRTDVTARDIYLLVASMGYFYCSNRYTLSAFLGEKLATPQAHTHWEAFMADTVLRTVAARPPLT